MNDFPKVLVVDDGHREPDHSLAADLAELGFSSVTASLEAADDVLAIIPAPAAIFLQVPNRTHTAERQGFVELAARLRAEPATCVVPIIVVDAAEVAHAGLFSMVKDRLAQALPSPGLT